jgi:eukaryotic-like serine/threonine-protein kinase
MTPERWQQVKSLFDAALGSETSERAGLLDRACAGDEDLRREVESLLAAHAGAGDRYEQAAVTADPLIGRQVGVYRIIRRLGTGGMGAVYLAARADDQFRRLVAVKTIRSELLDERTQRRFENERHTLAGLDHPNIVRLLDGGTTEDGMPYLVMDYVEGQPIDRYAKEHSLSIAERLALFRTLCAAVHFAHQNLVVHRDLKPANVLVTPQGIPKLLDFGIAKLVRPEYAAGAVGYTRTMAQPMTPEFASPEQIRGQPITTASDIYALGVLLYVLLTGVHPFERQTQSSYDLERAICEGEPGKPSDAAPTALARQLRGDLDVIVLTAIRKEPQRRYASAEHLAEDVRRFLEEQPVAARGESLAYRVRKFVGRHRVAVGVSLVAAGLLTYLGVSDYIHGRLAEERSQQLLGLVDFINAEADPAFSRGATEARKDLAEKALKTLQMLEKESKGDAFRQRYLMKQYLNVASVQGNLFRQNLGDAAAALASTNQALAMAQDLLRRDPKDEVAGAGLVQSHETLASLLEAAGDHGAALDHYRKASERAKGVDIGKLGVHFATVLTESALSQANAGDSEAALESLKQAEAILVSAQAKAPADQNLRAALVFTRERSVDFAIQLGRLAGGEAAKRDAIEFYENAPNAKTSIKARHNIAMAYKGLAEVQKREHKLPDALANCRHSLEISKTVHQEDPKNEQASTDMAQEYVLLVDLLLAGGRQAEARSETRQALEFLKPLVEKERKDKNYYYLVDCVTLMVTTPFAEFNNPQETLALATKAADQVKDAESFDLLAMAHDRAGNASEAVIAEQKAIALLPPVQPSHAVTEIRQRLTSNLQRFRLTQPARAAVAK